MKKVKKRKKIEINPSKYYLKINGIIIEIYKKKFGIQLIIILFLLKIFKWTKHNLIKYQMK